MSDLAKMLDENFGKSSSRDAKPTSAKHTRDAFEKYDDIVNAKMTAQAATANVALATVTTKVTELENDFRTIAENLVRLEARLENMERTQRFLTGQQSPVTATPASPTAGNATPVRPRAVVQMVQQLDKIATEKMLPEYGIASEQPFAEWAERFADVLAAADINDEGRKIALLKIKLVGWARQRFDGLTAAQTNTLANAVTALTGLFDTTDGQHAAMGKLKNFPPMQEGQSVMMYAEKLESLVKRALKGLAVDIIAQRLLEEFLDRMPYNLAFYVREKAPTTFQAALDHARKFEAIWAIPPRPIINTAPKTVNIAEVTELKDEISKLRSEMQQNVQRPKTPFECFYCKEPGHYARDCAKRKERMFQNRRPFVPRRDGERPTENASAERQKIKELEMRIEMLLNQNSTLANERRSFVNVVRSEESSALTPLPCVQKKVAFQSDKAISGTPLAAKEKKKSHF